MDCSTLRSKQIKETKMITWRRREGERERERSDGKQTNKMQMEKKRGRKKEIQRRNLVKKRGKKRKREIKRQ